MTFTSIGAALDPCHTRAETFARALCELQRDLAGAGLARPKSNPSPDSDQPNGGGRDFEQWIVLRLPGHEHSPGSATLIRIPHGKPAFDDTMIRPLGLSEIYPLMLTCQGRAQYREDHYYGTYQTELTIHLGERHCIQDTISAAAVILANDSFPFDDESLGFWPDLFVIHDQVQRLVLAGQAWGDDIRWSEPAASDDQVARVRAEVDQTYEEASFEAGWDNHETARQLRRRARVLKGHLVDVAWRARSRNALVATGAWRSPCPSPSDPLPVPSYATYRAA